MSGIQGSSHETNDLAGKDKAEVFSFQYPPTGWDEVGKTSGDLVRSSSDVSLGNYNRLSSAEYIFL